ncbi:MAG: hypothetical protein ABFD54_10040 [Armatimonadota bacterium]|nr:hypothetical protein [bacterium]
MDKIGESKRLADYCLMRMMLKWAGYLVIYMGVFTVINSIVVFKTIPRDGVQLIIGFIVLILGILLIKAPSANIMLAVGCFFFLILIWNGYTFTLKTFTAGQHFNQWPMAILVCVVSGCIFIKYYKRFVCLRDFEPSQQAVADMDKLITNTVKGDPEKDNDLIEFFTHKMHWKSRLMEDAALIVETRRIDLAYTGRDQFNITDNGNKFMSKFRKITVYTDDRKLTGQIAPEQLEKYQTWKDRI